MHHDLVEQPLDLPVFLRLLAVWTGYEFSASDWDAIRFGLFQRLGDPTVDDETEISYGYTFSGKPKIQLDLSWSPFPDDPGWIRVGLGTNRAVTRKAEAALDALNRRAEVYPGGYDGDPLVQVRRLLGSE